MKLLTIILSTTRTIIMLIKQNLVSQTPHNQLKTFHGIKTGFDTFSVTTKQKIFDSYVCRCCGEYFWESHVKHPKKLLKSALLLSLGNLFFTNLLNLLILLFLWEIHNYCSRFVYFYSRHFVLIVRNNFVLIFYN